MDKSKLKRLQKIQVEMLKDVDRVCRENDIQYYLTWGSALGAVRHGGFIPWDDDIDISMTWGNYKKFEKIAREKLGSKYFYQSKESDEHCFTTWNKVRVNNTTSMEKHLKHIKCHYGICMDVFPIVGVPNSKVEELMQRFLILLYRALRYERYLTNRKPEGNLLFKVIYGVFPRRFKEFLSEKCLNQITKYNPEECNEWVEFLSGKYSYMKCDKNIFGNGHEIMFEDIKCKIPEKYEEYLTKYYGDYMKLPDEADRVGHGDAIIDFEKSYEHYWE